MASIFNRLNTAFRTLIGADIKSTQTGHDPEFVDSSLSGINTINNNRMVKYSEYISMDDNYGQEISSSLDSVADLVLRIDEPLNQVVSIKTESVEVAKFATGLYSFLDLRSWLWTFSRSLSKFGDLFTEIIWATDGSNSKLSHIVGLKPLPAGTIYLNVNDVGVVNREYPYRQEIDGNEVTRFKPWQMVHFMLPREPTDDYGTSWLKAARIPHRQLLAMENALVIARLKKTNIRLHRVDVSGKTGDQAPDAIKEYKEQFTKKIWMNPNTGRMEKHNNPVMSNDDIYMGVTKDGGKFAGIDLLEGKSEIDIKDILYFREKLMVALKVPKHRININDIGASNKLVSVDQGLHFNASVQRVQMALVQGFRYVTDLGLLVKGVDIHAERNKYSLSLPKQRTTDELIAARVELIKSTVAKNYKELDILSNEEIMRSILHFDADRIARIQKEIFKFKAENGDDDSDGSGDDKDKNNDKNFNKTGTGSAPIRKPQKEDITKLLQNEEIRELVTDVSELMRNERVFNNKNFTDMGYIKTELEKRRQK